MTKEDIDIVGKENYYNNIEIYFNMCNDEDDREDRNELAKAIIDAITL